MVRGETVQRALQRLGKVLASNRKKKQKAAAKIDSSQAEAEAEAQNIGDDVDLKQATSDVETVTHLSSVLMSRFGRLDIYDQSYESLLQDVHKSGLVRQTFDPASRFNPDPASASDEVEVASASAQADEDGTEWEYRWTPAYLAAAAREAGTPVNPEIETFGPFSLSDLRSWADQGYFGESGERILVRPKGSKDSWTPYEKAVASL